MKQYNKAKITVEIISVSLIFLFTYAAINTIIAHENFVITLEQFNIDRHFILPLVIGLISTELAIVFLLLSSTFRQLGLLSSVGLMAVFLLYIGSMLLFSKNMPCSCGSVFQQLTWGQHLMLNTLILISSSIAFILNRNKNFIAIKQE